MKLEKVKNMQIQDSNIVDIIYCPLIFLICILSSHKYKCMPVSHI